MHITRYMYQVIQSDLFGMVKWPFQGLSDLQLGDKKGHFESPGIHDIYTPLVRRIHCVGLSHQRCHSGNLLRWRGPRRMTRMTPVTSFEVSHFLPLKYQHHKSSVMKNKLQWVSSTRRCSYAQRLIVFLILLLPKFWGLLIFVDPSQSFAESILNFFSPLPPVLQEVENESEINTELKSHSNIGLHVPGKVEEEISITCFARIPSIPSSSRMISRARASVKTTLFFKHFAKQFHADSWGDRLFEPPRCCELCICFGDPEEWGAHFCDQGWCRVLLPQVVVLRGQKLWRTTWPLFQRQLPQHQHGYCLQVIEVLAARYP